MKMRKRPRWLGVLTLNCVLLLCAHNSFGQNQPEADSTEIVKVKANERVLELIKTWDEKIWFFTSKEDPIKSLAGLKQVEVACWGAEHFRRVRSFFEAAEIDGGEGVRIIGPGNPIFTGMENPPRLFITWSKYAPDLKGAVRVQFVEEDEE